MDSKANKNYKSVAVGRRFSKTEPAIDTEVFFSILIKSTV